MPKVFPALLNFFKRSPEPHNSQRTEQLTKANEAIYKQNVELAIRNKTLSVLRNLSEITMKTTGVQEVTQHIVDIISHELNLAGALICLVDPKAHVLKIGAITQTPKIKDSFSQVGKPLDEVAISLDDTSNLAINAMNDKEQKITGNLLDLLTPAADQIAADAIERVTGIKTIIIYPLFFAERALGVLCLGLAKSVEDLSRTEKETLHEVINVVSIAIDRAELMENINKTNKDLEKANEKLELLDKLKDEFVSVASHELRTPMTAIKSYVWLALNGRGGSIDQKAREYLIRVYNSIERLIHLVNEMLDISRIESGRVTLNRTQFDMKKLIDDAMREFQAKATELYLSLSFECPEALPSVYADREKIYQVLENLVGNACKFTNSGGRITITAKVVGDIIEVSVADTGKGIKKEDMSKLFVKFSRLEHSLVTIAGSGSGLGLYIFRQYVELHGGKIWATSEEGKGSVFTFTLPVAKAI